MSMPGTGIGYLQEQDRLLLNNRFTVEEGQGIGSRDRGTMGYGSRDWNTMLTRLSHSEQTEGDENDLTGEGDIIEDVDSEEIKKSLLKKVDRRLSVLVLIYILNYVDRNNVSIARLKGFEHDLHLAGTQFSTLLSVLYIGYTIMQIPSNMFLHQLGKPSKYIPGCMAVWGLLSFLTGLTTSFYGALITRFLLGFVEAAFFPGALFLISKWYTPAELSQRTAYLASGSLISNAFGSLVASGVMEGLDGIRGLAGWRWLFFIEGALTVLVALWSMSILPDFPETKTTLSWLTPAERRLALRRMAEDVQEQNSSETSAFAFKPTNKTYLGQLRNRWPGLYLALADPKVWWLALTMSVMVVSLSFNAYFPTIVGTLMVDFGSAGLGHEHESTLNLILLLCVPPWVWATGMAILVNRQSDRKGERCRYIISSLFVGNMGFVLAMSTLNFTLRYISLFLMAQSYAGFICFLAWASSSVSQPPAKGAVALALINCVSQSGNIIGSYIWPLSWGPSYKLSFILCACMGSLAIVMCYFFRAHLAFLNRLGTGDQELAIGLAINLNGEERGEQRDFSKPLKYML